MLVDGSLVFGYGRMADTSCEAPRRRLPCFAGSSLDRFEVDHDARVGPRTRRATTIAAHGPDVGTHVVVVRLVVRLHLSDGQRKQTRRHLRKHGVYVNHARPQLIRRVLPVVSYNCINVTHRYLWLSSYSQVPSKFEIHGV